MLGTLTIQRKVWPTSRKKLHSNKTIPPNSPETFLSGLKLAQCSSLTNDKINILFFHLCQNEKTSMFYFHSGPMSLKPTQIIAELIRNLTGA